MERQKLVTVVVPIYNVEQYLKRCIDSIINQTYKNIELILVDDGSPDNCGKICDEYAKQDSRIKVIHKVNSGVSAARNDGIKNSNGDYIIFIDSDDCIEKDYIEYLYKLASENNCDVAACSHLEFYNEIKPVTQEEYIYILDKVDAFENLCYQMQIMTSPWGKIFKRNLFENIEFPVGVNCGEDLATIYKVIWNSNKIIVSNLRKYYYFQRENSLIKSKFSVNRMKSIKYAEEIVEFAKKNIPEKTKSAINRLFMEAIFIWIQIPKRMYYGEKKQLLDVIKKNRSIVLKDKKSKAGYRIIAFFTYIGMWSVDVLFKIKSKIGG